MQGRSLLALSILSAALACESANAPTEPGVAHVQVDPSKIITDGAHGGNKDFFFLPPMVPLPLHNPDFELGKFNNALRPSLRVDICELNSEPSNALPTLATVCNPAKAPIQTFAPGSVQLVNLPLRQNGWWTLLGLPADGFYYVLWDTRQSKLSLTKYYRIKVFVNGKPDPLGVADVDPMSNLTQWKYSLTGQVIQMVDDVLLPIPFRVEKGALCENGALCTSMTVTNDNPAGDFQVVQVQGNNGPIAGVKLPDGWLSCPTGVTCPPRPSSVVFTIDQVNTGANDLASGTQEHPCHPALPLQQFNSCFHFSTIPAITPYNAAGDQFGVYITVATCFVLADHIPLDPREPWVQLWSSDVDEAPNALASANSDDIMPVHSELNCGSNYDVIASNSGGLRGLASAGWRGVKSRFGKMFGVKTAYAVDLGLGGITKKISNVGPALTAKIMAQTSTELSAVSGSTPPVVTARMVGTKVHNGAPLGDVTLTGNTRGIPGLPVTFTLAPGNGTLSPFGGEAGPSTQITVTSSPILDSSLSGGLATVIWNLPTAVGTYTLTADGQAVGGPVTYTATVTGGPDFVISSGPLVLSATTVASTGGIVGFTGWTVKNQGATAAGPTGNQYYLSTDATITSGDTFLGSDPNPALQPGETFTSGPLNFSIPPLPPGTYYLGILIDSPNQVAETDEGNNYVSAPFEVKPAIDFETYPPGAGVCDGAAACRVTDEFASLGVVFSIEPNPQGLNTAFLCRTPHGPAGEGSNYGVSPEATSDCSGWFSGTVTMSFASHPTTIEFHLEGNAGGASPFEVTAADAAGNPLTVSNPYSFGYQDQFGNSFRRETRRVTSPDGIATITVPSISAVHFIDNLWITQ